MYRSLKTIRKACFVILPFTISITLGCNRPGDTNSDPVAVTNDDVSEIQVPAPDPNFGILTGTIRDAAGSPVAGALVKVNGTDTGLSYMVVSQGDGAYTTPKLLPGDYSVQAFGGTNWNNSSDTVSVGRGQVVQVDREMNSVRNIPPPITRLTNLDYVELMPEGDAKKIIAARCTMCHGLDRVVPARKAPQSWQITIDRMTWFLADRPDLGGPVSDRDKELILDYVSTHFNRDAPRVRKPGITDLNQHLPTELLEGEQARFIAMTFAPQVDDGIAESEFGIDSNGDVWISEVDMPHFGRFDTDTLTYTRIDPPQGNFTRSFGQIAPDPDDKIWILDNGSSPNSELLHYDPVIGDFQSYRITAPLRYRATINTLRFLDGNVWGSGNASSRVIKLNPATGEVTSYPSPRGAHPFGIAIGADRAVWYIANYNSEIVRLDPVSGEQTAYRTPSPRSGVRRMGADAVGYLWAGALDANKLVKLDSRTGQITEYEVPTPNSGPYSADVDDINNLVWLSMRDADKVVRFDPATETFVEFPLPAAGIQAQRILVDPTNPRRVWWTCSATCSVGYIETLE